VAGSTLQAVTRGWVIAGLWRISRSPADTAVTNKSTAEGFVDLLELGLMRDIQFQA